MNTGGEAADQVIRMSLNGMEVAAKISGKAAIEVANMLYAIMKDQKKTKGKTRLENLISTGKPLTVFTLKNDDLASFQKEAKKYGILYYAIRNQKADSDGMVDIMVKTEDAPRLNRIVERFKLSDVSQAAQVKTDIERSLEQKKRSKTEKEHPLKSKVQIIKDKKEVSPIKQEDNSLNPKLARTTKSRPSEPIFDPAMGTSDKPIKPSVRAELNQIKAEKAKDNMDVSKEDKVKTNPSNVKHPQHKNKKKKSKER